MKKFKKFSRGFVCLFLCFSLILPTAHGALPAIPPVVNYAGTLLAAALIDQSGRNISDVFFNWLFGKGEDPAEIPDTMEEFIQTPMYKTYYNHLNVTINVPYEEVTEDNSAIYKHNATQSSYFPFLVDGWRETESLPLVFFESRHSLILAEQKIMQDNYMQAIRDSNLAKYDFSKGKLLTPDRILVKYETNDLPYAQGFKSTFVSNIFQFEEDTDLKSFSLGTSSSGMLNTNSELLLDGKAHAIIDDGYWAYFNFSYDLFACRDFDYYNFKYNPVIDTKNWEHISRINGSTLSLEKDVVYTVVASLTLSKNSNKNIFNTTGYVSLIPLSFTSTSNASINGGVSNDPDFKGNVYYQYENYYYDNGWDTNPPTEGGTGGGSDGSGSGGSGGDANINGDLNLNVNGGLDHNVSGDLDININLPDWWGSSGNDPPSGDGGEAGGEGDSSNGSSGGGFFDGILTGIIKLVGAVAEALLVVLTTVLNILTDLLLKVISLLVGVVTNIFQRILALANENVLADVGALFGWLPEEVQSLLTLGIIIAIGTGIWKVVRG